MGIVFFVGVAVVEQGWSVVIDEKRTKRRKKRSFLLSLLSSLSIYLSLSLSLSGSLSYQVSATLTLMILTLLSFLPWARSLLFELT